MSFTLPFPVKQELDINGNKVVLLKLPSEVIYNRNVFCIDVNGNVLWQIEELLSYPGPYKKCHYAHIEFKAGKLILWNWCDLKLIVDPQTGVILSKEEVR